MLGTLARRPGLGENVRSFGGVMIRKTLVSLASVGFVALVACSGDEATEKYPDANAFCSAKATEVCNAQAALCGATVDACKSKYSASCNAAGAGAGGGRSYKASLAEECITKTHDLFNQKTFTADQEKTWKDTCERVFAGTKVANTPCANDYECVDQLVCDKGVCGTKTEKNQGEGCSNAGEVCAKGSYCGDQGALKFCLPKGDEGKICSANAPCKEDLRCVGTCSAKLNIGDVCGGDDDCKEVSTPPYCDPATTKCAAKFSAGTQSCKDLGG
jgi:hypothetical protein